MAGPPIQASPDQIPSSQRRGGIAGWIVLIVLYIIVGLVVGAFGLLSEEDIIGGGSMIDDPGDRARIDGLQATAAGLWVAGGIALIVGAMRLRSVPSGRGRRAFIGVVVLAPLLWLIFSVWVIQETGDVIRAAHPRTPTPVAGLIETHAPEAGTAVNEGSADVPIERGDLARTGVMPGPGPGSLPTIRWRFVTGGKVWTAPAVVDGVVYFGSEDKHVYALDATTGELRWRYKTGDWVRESVTVADGFVFAGSYDGKLYALDAATGNRRWTFDGGSFRSPAVADGVVYVSGKNGLYSLDQSTGKQRWIFVHTYLQTPSFADGTVYVGSIDQFVYALDAQTGSERWRFDTGDLVTTPVVVGDTLIYVVNDDGDVFAIDRTSGQEKWHYNAGEFESLAALALSGDTLVASGGKLVFGVTLFALDAQTGVERWHVDLGDILLWSVTVVGDRLYLADSLGLRSLDAESGNQVWLLPIRNIVTEIAVVNGVIYAGGSDGVMTAVSS